jgi:hypothetical protein
MKSANRPWPPLIVAAHVPRAVKWRDFLVEFNWSVQHHRS